MEKFKKVFGPSYWRYAVKMGIACSLAFVASHYAGSQYAVWSVVSTIIAMQLNVAESLQAGINRIAGTIIGAVIGATFLVFCPKDTLSIGIAVFVITTAGAFLTRYNKFFSSASIAGSIVLLGGAVSVPDEWHAELAFAALRMVEIIIGVGAAFVVSIFLWPVRLFDTLQTDLSLQYSTSAKLVRTIINAYISGEGNHEPDELADLIHKSWSNHERFIKVLKHESMVFHCTHEVTKILIGTLDRTLEYLRAMLEALNDYDGEAHACVLSQELYKLAQVVSDSLIYIGGDTPTENNPDLVRRLTLAVAATEERLEYLSSHDDNWKEFTLHSGLQLFSIYQAMRMLSEALLIALDKLHGVGQRYYCTT